MSIDLIVIQFKRFFLSLPCENLFKIKQQKRVINFVCTGITFNKGTKLFSFLFYVSCPAFPDKQVHKSKSYTKITFSYKFQKNILKYFPILIIRFNRTTKWHSYTKKTKFEFYSDIQITHCPSYLRHEIMASLLKYLHTNIKNVKMHYFFVSFFKMKPTTCC